MERVGAIAQVDKVWVAEIFSSISALNRNTHTHYIIYTCIKLVAAYYSSGNVLLHPAKTPGIGNAHEQVHPMMEKRLKCHTKKNRGSSVFEQGKMNRNIDGILRDSCVSSGLPPALPILLCPRPGAARAGCRLKWSHAAVPLPLLRNTC